MARKGKSLTEEYLPDRRVLSQLTGGDSYQRSLSNYAKATPSTLDGTATRQNLTTNLQKVTPS